VHLIFLLLTGFRTLISENGKVKVNHIAAYTLPTEEVKIQLGMGLPVYKSTTLFTPFTVNPS